MADDKVFHGAIALIKSGGLTIGKIRSIRFSEAYQRADVQGVGTIFSSEVPVTKFKGTLSCSKMSVSFKDGIFPAAIKRNFTNIGSQVLTGGVSYEDNLLLDDTGVTIEVYKKVKDVVNPDGSIKPKVVPYAIIRRFFIESSGLDVSEGAISGEDISGTYLDPVTFPD